MRFARIHPMKLWLSKSTDVPLQEQLSTQVVLGIVSGDLTPDERLPSSLELARRFKVHPNTVRACYRGLARDGWIQWKRGSGFYVRDRGAEGRPDPGGLDHLISSFLTSVQRRGYSAADIQSRLRERLNVQRPNRILVLEANAELREILVAEIREHVSLTVDGVVPGRSGRPIPEGVLCVALFDHARSVRAALPPEESCVFLRSNSVPKTLSREKKPQSEMLICVASRWPDFLRWARTTLTAVGISRAAIELRDGRVDGWDRGLAAYNLVVTDSVLGRMLPQSPRLRIFRIIADDSLQELRERINSGSRV